jgi:hypothetical protein
MTLFKKCFALLLLFSSLCSYAQLLPDNTSLNVQSVQRWMDSNRDFSSVIQALDALHKSEDDLKKFDALSANEQDKKIADFLQKNNLWESTAAITMRHGWKSAGEYMRLSTKLGNAIAAYFFTQEIASLSESQKKSLRAKTDEAVLNTPQEDIVFVKAHETLLKTYIQAYSKGR